MRKRANRCSVPSPSESSFVDPIFDDAPLQELKATQTTDFEWTGEVLKPLFHFYEKDVVHLIHFADTKDIASMYTFYGNKIVSKFTHELCTRRNYCNRFSGIGVLDNSNKNMFAMIALSPDYQYAIPNFYKQSEVEESYGFTNTVIVPVHKPGQYCNNCGKKGEFKCDCCMSVWYCSERCQRKDEVKHFEVTEKISEIPENQPVIIIRSINSLKTKNKYVPRVHPDPKSHEMLQWINVALSVIPKDLLENMSVVFKYEKLSDVGTFKFYGNLMRFNCDVGLFHAEHFVNQNGTVKKGKGYSSVCVTVQDEVLFADCIKCLQKKMYGPKLLLIKTNHPWKSCNHCGLQGVSKKCTCCASIYYCSSQCQKADWANHKKFSYEHKGDKRLVLCLRMLPDCSYPQNSKESPKNVMFVNATDFNNT
jgi:hypothetical protein